ncbi:putative nuclease HARBI1, partial [Huso huso]
LLVNQESFRGVADRFGMSKGTLHHAFLQFVNGFINLMPKYICWSLSDQFPELAGGFQRNTGFPGVIGCIDRTHIPVRGPSEHRDSFINIKGHASFHPQAVCDSNLKCTNIFTGYVGSVHDACVYRNSDLKKYFDSNPLPVEFHLLDDAAYPLDAAMITPFRDNGHLSETQRRFNTSHSSTHVHIEKAFGLLKCKLRRLHHLDMTLVHRIPSVIASACILHTFVLINESLDDEYQHAIDEVPCQRENPHNTEDESGLARRRIAEEG